MPGVEVVRDGDFIGVVADDVWTAEQAALKINAQWKVPPQISNAELFAELKKGAGDDGQSEIAAALANAEVKLEQTYTVAYIAHAPLEPRAAVAEWTDGKLTVWTGTQRPFGVKDDLVKAFRLAPEQVRVLMPDMGSGYGGKHTGECAVEAARLAKAAGKPVKLIWTRAGGVHVGVLPAGGSDGDSRGRAEGRDAGGVGAPQLQLGAVGRGDSV